MKVLIAPDKFKGSLTAVAAADAIASRLARLRPQWQFDLCPLADGGEGTLDAVLPNSEARTTHSTWDAQMRPLDAPYGLFLGDNDSTTVLVESAACLGLGFLPPTLRNPETATSYGLGVLLRQAITEKPDRAILALGGVATVDGGLGFLQALGGEFQTPSGPIQEPASASHLSRITRADLAPARKLLQTCKLETWCDVLSPLLGPSGAARMFGPQKGADSRAVENIENGMNVFAAILETECGFCLRDIPGAGAAGGLGMAVAALGAPLQSGFLEISKRLNLRGRIRRCDVVVTGEGRLDASTRQGKAPWGVLQTAIQEKIPCYAIAGYVTEIVEGFAATVSLYDDVSLKADPQFKDLNYHLDRATQILVRLSDPQ